MSTTTNKIMFTVNTGEVIAALTPVFAPKFTALFDIEVIMLRAATGTDPLGRSTYRFIMPDDGRREALEAFLEEASVMNRYEMGLN